MLWTRNELVVPYYRAGTPSRLSVTTKNDLVRDLYSGFYATADNISNMIISGTHRRVPQINDASAAATAQHCFLPLICCWTSGGGWGEDDVVWGLTMKTS